jgi:PIN domain nuclease of toxin-antitoxin system
MKILLDTNILLMWLVDDPTLSREIWGHISDPFNEVYVSTVTGLDIVDKKLRHQLECPNNLEGICLQSGFQLLTLEMRHIVEYENMMRHEAEPLDLYYMLLIAQAKVDSLTMATTYSAINRFNISYIIHKDNPYYKPQIKLA